MQKIVQIYVSDNVYFYSHEITREYIESYA